MDLFAPYSVPQLPLYIGPRFITNTKVYLIAWRIYRIDSAHYDAGIWKNKAANEEHSRQASRA